MVLSMSTHSGLLEWLYCMYFTQVRTNNSLLTVHRTVVYPRVSILEKSDFCNILKNFKKIFQKLNRLADVYDSAIYKMFLGMPTGLRLRGNTASFSINAPSDDWLFENLSLS